jgi:hypothetical protein
MHPLPRISGRRDASHLLNKGTLATSREAAELTNSQQYDLIVSTRPGVRNLNSTVTACLPLGMNYNEMSTEDT